MTRRLLLATAASIVIALTPARGDVVVELFTSQGCSSCPPADAVLGKLAERDDVVALAFHVDYWDYLGWKDTFASAENTARQVSYRDAWHERVIYTPQAVIQGASSVPAAAERKLNRAISEADSHDGMLRIEPGASGLTAHLDPVAIERPCTVWIAQYRLKESVAIGRGENRGRTITYHNIVTSLDRLGDWSGTEGQTLMLPQPGPGEGVAVWLQDGPGGPILAAADWEN